MKRGLVISGGGSLGSFAGGICEYLMKEKKIDWDVLVGTSTGSLLVPLISLGEIDNLKEKFTNINNSDVFSKEPFRKNGKLNIINAITRVILGKTSLGDASNLLKQIKKTLSIEDYYKPYNKDVFVTVSNMTKSKIEYKKMGEETYDDFCDWILASASVPILFDIVKKNGFEYLDGGIIDPIPIQKAIDEDCDIIDVIILSPNIIKDKKYSRNIFDVAINTITLMNEEINKNDIQISKLQSKSDRIKLNIYRIPFEIEENLMFFDKKIMTKWWKDGYEFAKNIGPKSNDLEKFKSKKGYKLK